MLYLQVWLNNEWQTLNTMDIHENPLEGLAQLLKFRDDWANYEPYKNLSFRISPKKEG